MQRVFREYEQRKAERGLRRLRGPARADDPDVRRRRAARGAVRERFRAFTVDEYQDVNLLQQTLLDRWLGERDELCVVGDDYQSIYALHRRVARVPARRCRQRFPHATVVRLEENYRSSPQVLELANRLVPQLGGAEKTLRATLGRARSPSCAVRDAGGRDGVRRRRACARSQRGRPARGDGGALPDERAAGRLRGGVRTRPASRSRARRCSGATRRASC